MQFKEVSFLTYVKDGGQPKQAKRFDAGSYAELVDQGIVYRESDGTQIFVPLSNVRSAEVVEDSEGLTEIEKIRLARKEMELKSAAQKGKKRGTNE